MSKLKLASVLFLLSTILLKLSSMIRDLLIANLFGVSYITDAYLAAMVIPNAIILFMLTGMKDAFLPSYIKFEKNNQGLSHLTNIVKGTFWIGLGIAAIGSVLSPIIIRFLYPDFNEHGTTIATWTAIIYFSSVIFVGVNAVYEGYFDAKRRFSFSTFSQTVVVFSTIAGALLLSPFIGVYSLPIGYLVGTILSFIIKFIALYPDRFMIFKQPMHLPEVTSFYKIFLPVGLTIAVGQVNLLVNTLFATRMGEGVASYLNYAFRLVSIPQAIFGVTVATIVFPILSQAKANHDMGQFRLGMEKGLSMMFLFLAPTITGMVYLMKEMIVVVYERGAFDPAASAATTEVGYFYIGSVLFYSIQAVVAKGFYTLEKGNLMLRIGMISIVLNIIFNAALSQLMGYQGLALSASVVGFLYSAMTFFILYRMIGGLNLQYIGKEYGKVLFSTGVMLAILIFVDRIEHLATLNIYLYLLLMIVIGASVYFSTLFLVKSKSFNEMITRTIKEKAQ